MFDSSDSCVSFHLHSSDSPSNMIFIGFFYMIIEDLENSASCKNEFYYLSFFIRIFLYLPWILFISTRFSIVILHASARWKRKILLSIHYSSYAHTEPQYGITRTHSIYDGNIGCFVWVKVFLLICKTIWRRFISQMEN